MEKAAAALLEGLNANEWVQLTSVVCYMEAYEEIAMRYNGIFRTLLGAALVLVLMVPAPGLAQTGTTDKIKATAWFLCHRCPQGYIRSVVRRQSSTL